MGRIRNLKPEFGHNDKLSALSAEVHLFAALLLTHVDDEGYFNANPKLLHAAVCPLRELSVSVHDILTELSRIGFINLSLGSDGRQYGQIVNFMKHQYINRPTPSKIKLTLGALRESSVSPPSARAVVEVEVEVEVEEKHALKNERAPEELHPLNYARILLEDLNFPLTGDNMRTVAMSVEAEIKSGKTAESAYEFILAGTRDAKDEGWEINRFFFADAKYRRENRENSRGANKPNGINNNTQVKRAFNNIAAVATVLGGSNRVATATGSAKVEHPRLGNGSGQKARSSPAHPAVLDGKVKKDS